MRSVRIKIEELLERLETVESNKRSGYTGHCTNWHRNPDGPEAATTIRALLEREAKLREYLVCERDSHRAHGNDVEADELTDLIGTPLQETDNAG